MPRIFISYNRQDLEFASRVAHSLAEMGAQVWIDVESIPAGSKWSKAVQDALDSSDVMLVVVSAESMDSDNVEREWHYFMESRKRIIPLLFRPAKIHYLLSNLQHVDFIKHSYDTAFEQLGVELERLGVTLVRFTLEVLDGPEAYMGGENKGRTLALARKKVSIGRNGQVCDIQFYDIATNSSVSRTHCVIAYDEKERRFLVTDEGSSIGTYVNGVRCQVQTPMALKNNDEIELGNVAKSGVRLRFSAPVAFSNDATPMLVDASAFNKTDEKRVSRTGGVITENPDVFLCYAREDTQLGRRLEELLHKESFEVWTDEGLTPGTAAWESAIELFLHRPKCVVVLLSPEAKASPWVARQLEEGKKHNMPVVPLLVRGDNDTSLPPMLIGVRHFDLRTDFKGGFQRALVAIREAVQTPKEHNPPL